MKLAHMTGWELKALLAQGEISSQDVLLSVLNEIDQKEQQIRAYITRCNRSKLLAEAEAIDIRRSRGEHLGALGGLPVAVKDNISTAGLRTTCASRILSGYVPAYDATVVKRIRKADGIIIGKTNLDEFSMGSSTENSAMQVTRNPHNLDYVPGGTSGGSAAAVAADETIFAIGSDTGGSIRLPASYCGVVGVKPTYGRVSRNGLIAYGSSLDQIGVLTKDVRDAALLLQVIAGFDENDSTSTPSDPPCFLDEGRQEQRLRIGVPEQFFENGLDDEVRVSVERAIDLLHMVGHTIVPISLPHASYAIPAYYITACCEASSNLSRYTGVSYGFRDTSVETYKEQLVQTRTVGFGPEVKRRIMLGTFALSAGYRDAYYGKASQVRQLIGLDFEQAFKLCDVVIHPVAPAPAFRVGEKVDDPLSMYLIDVYTVTANLVGLPAASIPCGWSQEGLPIGVQLCGAHHTESTLLSVSLELETVLHQTGAWIRKVL